MKTSSIVYLNGSYIPAERAHISIFDRGFLFSDSVYEVIAVLDGRLVDFDAHLARLRHSLAALDIPCPLGEEDFLTIHRTLIQKNSLQEGIVYLQISRGQAPQRDFLPPEKKDLQPTLCLFTQEKTLIDAPVLRQGLRVCTVPDLRWGRCDLKTTQLLYSSMMKAHAVQQGFDDSWFVRDNRIVEGTSSTTYIITEDKCLLTPPHSYEVLPGVTRNAILELLDKTDLSLRESSFTPPQAYAAQEAFITGSARLVCPVIAIDGHSIGTGKPGPYTRRLQEIYVAHALETAV